eukprot:TRINITY_DN28101_c0_g1_i1.p1 TRINITY_DN28101_c0_g1~~TRINITY_DN28101_c0_g1_i1.p1  ORF type:complete len:379 (+),score=154.66 TRINITY_DN28101_c0_g1_i1:42-1178(+)
MISKSIEVQESATTPNLSGMFREKNEKLVDATPPLIVHGPESITPDLRTIFREPRQIEVSVTPPHFKSVEDAKNVSITPDLRGVFQEPKDFIQNQVAATPPLIKVNPKDSSITPDLRNVFNEPKQKLVAATPPLVKYIQEMKQAPTTPDLKKMFKEPKKYTKGFVAATPPLIVPFPPVKQEITPELREVFVEPRDYVENQFPASPPLYMIGEVQDSATTPNLSRMFREPREKEEVPTPPLTKSFSKRKQIMKRCIRTEVSLKQMNEMLRNISKAGLIMLDRNELEVQCTPIKYRFLYEESKVVKILRHFGNFGQVFSLEKLFHEEKEIEEQEEDLNISILFDPLREEVVMEKAREVLKDRAAFMVKREKTPTIAISAK